MAKSKETRTRDEPGGYIEKLNHLSPRDANGMLVLDLFAGCGGLALGFEAAGFRTLGYEANKDCCATYNANLEGRCVTEFLTRDSEFPSARIVVGGPPCQPFSVNGNQKGVDDPRNGFPAFLAAIRKTTPDLFMLENVRGLLYRNRWYLDEIVAEFERLDYLVDCQLLNAVHYGVPQNRERVIIVGHRGGYRFPARVNQTVTAGEALGELAAKAPPESKFLTPGMDKYIANYEKASKCVTPRDLHLDRPARTLTCRNLAGATGDMHRVRLPDGRRRRLSVREAARLQSFPDWFVFHGGADSAFTQIGNAVPPLFGYHLAKSVSEYFENKERETRPAAGKTSAKDRQPSLS